MNELKEIKRNFQPATDVADNAGGVPKRQWYIAIVKHNWEKKFSQLLDRENIENYLPTQEEIRVWKNGRKSKVDRIVIPSVVFTRCTEQTRRGILKLPYICRFMTDTAGKTADSAVRSIATVSDNEINRLKFMLGQSDIPVTVSGRSFSKGDKVRVIRGSLKGITGEVTEMKSPKCELIVDLNLLGSARLMIDSINIELVDK